MAVSEQTSSGPVYKVLVGDRGTLDLSVLVCRDQNDNSGHCPG